MEEKPRPPADGRLDPPHEGQIDGPDGQRDDDEDEETEIDTRSMIIVQEAQPGGAQRDDQNHAHRATNARSCLQRGRHVRIISPWVN